MIELWEIINERTGAHVCFCEHAIAVRMLQSSVGTELTTRRAADDAANKRPIKTEEQVEIPEL